MNPSFALAMTATLRGITDTACGIKRQRKQHETSINGRAFAPGKGVQQETGPEKEAKVRKHLDQLAAEAKARSIYPRSDMVEAMEEEMEAQA